MCHPASVPACALRGDGHQVLSAHETLPTVYAPLQRELVVFARQLHLYIASVSRSFETNDQDQSRIPEEN